MKGFTCNFEEGKEYRSTNGFIYKLSEGKVLCSSGRGWSLAAK